MSYTQQQLDEWSGAENTRSAPFYQIPLITFDSGIGKFYLSGKTESEEKQEGDKLTGVILKVRVAYGEFAKDNSYRLFTNEQNSKNGNFILTKNTKQRGNQVVVQGLIDYLKSRYPNLKMRHVLYILLPSKDVAKLTVKGKSFVNLLEYYAEFGVDEHTRDYFSELGVRHEIYTDEKTHEEKEYYSITFLRGREVEDKEVVAEKIKEIKEAIEKVDEFYSVKSIQETETTEIETPVILKPVKTEDIPVIEEEKKEDGEIDVNQIPF